MSDTIRVKLIQHGEAFVDVDRHECMQFHIETRE